MSELAYLNGQFVPAANLAIPVIDSGFVQGLAVAEQVRTFSGGLFRWEEHLRRLQHSLEIVGLEGIDLDGLSRAAQELVRHNHALLRPGDDLALSLFVTPGPYPSFAPPGPVRPTVGMHTYPLPFHMWADKYDQGQRLVVPSIRQVPENCWPSELKCRSRMHYYLADREASRREPGARSLLLDQEGFVTEASTANVVIFRKEEGFVSPPRERILPGVSVGVLQEIAQKLGVAFTHRPLTVEDVAKADEVLLSSTSPCLLPVISLDGRPIANGRPGPMVQTALAAWSELVGLDIVGQAHRFASSRR